jgi:AcrR family transcriptional regulator
MGAVKKRRRRSAEEARALILDAAEKRLAEGGPGGIRLQDVAADVGVSHPAILHHFGSREALLSAVVERSVGALETDLVQAFQSSTGEPPDGAEMLERVYVVLAEKGHARVLAWLILSGYADALDSKGARANWKAIIDGLHGMRTAAGFEGDHEDTAFTVVLSALAIFGQAIAGPGTFKQAGLDRDRAAPLRFRRWLATVLSAHLSHQ